MIRSEKLTQKSQEALATASELAQGKSHSQVEPVHLLAALLSDPQGLVPEILFRIGIRPEAIEPRLNEELKHLPVLSGPGQVYLSPHLNQILEKAKKESEKFKDEFVSVEHLILALAEQRQKPSRLDFEEPGGQPRPDNCGFGPVARRAAGFRSRTGIKISNPREIRQGFDRAGGTGKIGSGHWTGG